MLTENQAKKLAINAIEVANEKLEDGGWDSRVVLSEVFQDAEGGWNVEVIHGQEVWGENNVYPLDENTDVDDLSEDMKEDCAFIEGDDSEWGDDDDWDSDDDDDYWGDDE